jgi:hypothetical protein
MRNRLVRYQKAGAEAPPRRVSGTHALRWRHAPALFSTAVVTPAAQRSAPAQPSAWQILVDTLAALAAAGGGHSV